MSFENSSERLDLERFIAKTEAEFLMVANRMETLSNQIEKSNEELGEMEDKLITNSMELTSLTREVGIIKTEMTDVKGQLKEVSTKIDKLGSNSFLVFTNDFDLKKLVISILTIASVVSSPSLITSYFQSNTTDTEASLERIEKIIEILETQ